MRLFRHIAATLLAILIANPLCCCYASTSGGMSSSSCCASQDNNDKQSPSETPCNGCQVKNPRLADGGKSPILPFFALELPLEERCELPTVPAVGINRAVVGVDPLDLRPPRLLLALQQRYLI
jgi:hypothetical protein